MWHSAKFTAVEGGVAAAGFGAGYVASRGNLDTALFYANMGSMVGGAAAARWVKCFVGDTLVHTIVPVEQGALPPPVDAEAAVAATGGMGGSWLAAVGVALGGLAAGAAVEGYRRLRKGRQEAAEARIIDELFEEGALDNVLEQIADELATAITGRGKGTLGF